MARTWTRSNLDVDRRRQLAQPILDALLNGVKFSAALRRAGIHKTTFFRWRRVDPVLADAFKTAIAASRRVA